MKRVLVIGDCIADVYHDCIFKKMCPDNPSVEAIVRAGITTTNPGGAANVALNVAALIPDAIVDLIGIVPYELKGPLKILGEGHVNTEYSYLSYDGINVKERFMVGDVMKLRVDSEIRPEYDYKVEISLVKYLREHTPDLIIVSDYSHGAIGPGVIRLLLPYRDRLLVDTKMTDLSVFGSDGIRTKILKINNAEFSAALAVDAVPERFFECMIVTKGAEGALVTIHSDLGSGRSSTNTVFVTGFHVNTVDVCGCGDTFLAGLAASLLKVDDPYGATRFANAAAATVVTKPRTAIADLGATLKLLGRT